MNYTLKEKIYWFCCQCFYLLRIALGRARWRKTLEFFYLSEEQVPTNKDRAFTIEVHAGAEGPAQVVRAESLYPVENVSLVDANLHLPRALKIKAPLARCFGVSDELAESVWLEFVASSIIPDGYRNAGYYYAGSHLRLSPNWCLPSWIWTSAAACRLWLQGGLDERRGLELANLFLRDQLPEGGWVVRNDFSDHSAIPVVAPNDSAYIATHAMLPAYAVSQDKRFLDSAQNCAEWVIESARQDGLVWTGKNRDTGSWNTDRIIVDTGFTLSLFADLLRYREDQKYYGFIEKFSDSFVDKFFDPTTGGFCTSVSSDGERFGGRFARGQAWALEGLISAYTVTKSERINMVIQKVISGLVRSQARDGGWPYNLDRPYLGQDCKGTAVLAKAFLLGIK